MFSRFFPPTPRHVRLHVLHQGAAAGDMTIDGWQIGERGGYLLLERASIVQEDGKLVRLEGHVDVPLERVLLREHVLAMSGPIGNGIG